MTDENAFPPVCGFEVIPKIPDDPWIEDPDVPDPPPPVHDVPDSPPPIPPPDFPCPAFPEGDFDADVDFYDPFDELGKSDSLSASLEIGVRQPKLGVRFSPSSDGCCGFEVESYAEIPFTNIVPGHLWDNPHLNYALDTAHAELEECTTPDKVEIRLKIEPVALNGFIFRLFAKLPCGYARQAIVAVPPACNDDACGDLFDGQGNLVTNQPLVGVARFIDADDEGCLSYKDLVPFYSRLPLQPNQPIWLSWNGRAWIAFRDAPNYLVILEDDIPAASQAEDGSWTLGSQIAWVWRRESEGEGGFSQIAAYAPVNVRAVAKRDCDGDCEKRRVYNPYRTAYSGCVLQEAIVDESGDLYIVPGVGTSTTSSSSSSSTAPGNPGEIVPPSPCTGRCRWLWEQSAYLWRKDEDGCETTSSSSTAVPTTSSSSSTAADSSSSTASCQCPPLEERTSSSSSTAEGETSSSSSTAAPEECECAYPTFCGTEDGQCTYTYCTTLDITSNLDCIPGSSSSSTSGGDDGSSSSSSPECDCDTTSSSSTTPPDEPDCTKGCKYFCMPLLSGGAQLVLIENKCLASCPCEPPEVEECDDCATYGAGCQPPTEPPPPCECNEICDGGCWFLFIPFTGTWVRQYYGCIFGNFCCENPRTCVCQPPSEPGEPCVGNGCDGCNPVYVDCGWKEKTPGSSSSSTAGGDPPDPCGYCYETSSSSTAPPSSSSSTGPGGCTGTCIWEADLPGWAKITDECSPGCNCGYPGVAPASACDTHMTVCTKQDTTTSSSSSTASCPCDGDGVTTNFCRYRKIYSGGVYRWDLEYFFCQCGGTIEDGGFSDCNCGCPPENIDAYTLNQTAEVECIPGPICGQPSSSSSTAGTTSSTTAPPPVAYVCNGMGSCFPVIGGTGYETIEECEEVCDGETSTTSTTSSSSSTPPMVWVCGASPCSCDQVPLDEQPEFYVTEGECLDACNPAELVWFCTELGCVEAPCNQAEGEPFFLTEGECEADCAGGGGGCWGCEATFDGLVCVEGPCDAEHPHASLAACEATCHE